jgi:hypothetical protein
VCWGHQTGVVEGNIRDFDGNWTGTGEVVNPGAGDSEQVCLQHAEYMISEIVDTGTQYVQLLQNHYDPTGDDVTLEYRHGNTPAACVAAGWNVYAAIFMSLGFVQIKLTATI